KNYNFNTPSLHDARPISAGRRDQPGRGGARQARSGTAQGRGLSNGNAQGCLAGRDAPAPAALPAERSLLRAPAEVALAPAGHLSDRKSTRLNSSHVKISY